MLEISRESSLLLNSPSLSTRGLAVTNQNTIRSQTLNVNTGDGGIKACSFTNCPKSRSGKLDTLGLRPCVRRQSYKSSKICALRKHHGNKRNPVNQENPSYASGDGEPETSPERVAQGEKYIPDHCCRHTWIDPFLRIVISDSDESRSLLVNQALGSVG